MMMVVVVVVLLKIGLLCTQFIDSQDIGKSIFSYFVSIIPKVICQIWNYNVVSLRRYLVLKLHKHMKLPLNALRCLYLRICNWIYQRQLNLNHFFMLQMSEFPESTANASPEMAAMLENFQKKKALGTTTNSRQNMMNSSTSSLKESTSQVS